MSEMEYIRKRYHVPARRGMRVIAHDGDYRGRITSAKNGLLKVRGDNGFVWLHPLDRVIYLDDEPETNERLVPPRNLIRFTPKSCYSCRWFNTGNQECVRPDGPYHDDIVAALMYVCDLFEHR